MYQKVMYQKVMCQKGNAPKEGLARLKVLPNGEERKPLRRTQALAIHDRVKDSRVKDSFARAVCRSFLVPCWWQGRNQGKAGSRGRSSRERSFRERSQQEKTSGKGLVARRLKLTQEQGNHGQNKEIDEIHDPGIS